MGIQHFVNSKDVTLLTEPIYNNLCENHFISEYINEKESKILTETNFKKKGEVLYFYLNEGVIPILLKMKKFFLVSKRFNKQGDIISETIYTKCKFKDFKSKINDFDQSNTDILQVEVKFTYKNINVNT